MERIDIAKAIDDFIRHDILDGAPVELNESTELLRSGVIDSFSLLALINFLNDKLSVNLRLDTLEGSGGLTIRALSELALRSVPRRRPVEASGDDEEVPLLPFQ